MHLPILIAMTDFELISIPPESQAWLPLISRLRGWGVVVLLIALSASALLAARGKVGAAICVATGAIVLFGGGWFVGMLQQATDGVGERFAPPAAEFAERSGPEGTSGVPAVIRQFGREGIHILTKSIPPFVLIYTIWVAIGVPMVGFDEETLASLVVGGAVTFGATILGQLFSI